MSDNLVRSWSADGDTKLEGVDKPKFLSDARLGWRWWSEY